MILNFENIPLIANDSDKIDEICKRVVKSEHSGVAEIIRQDKDDIDALTATLVNNSKSVIHVIAGVEYLYGILWKAHNIKENFENEILTLRQTGIPVQSSIDERTRICEELKDEYDMIAPCIIVLNLWRLIHDATYNIEHCKLCIFEFRSERDFEDEKEVNENVG